MRLVYIISCRYKILYVNKLIVIITTFVNSLFDKQTDLIYFQKIESVLVPRYQYCVHIFLTSKETKSLLRGRLWPTRIEIDVGLTFIEPNFVFISKCVIREYNNSNTHSNSYCFIFIKLTNIMSTSSECTTPRGPLEGAWCENDTVDAITDHIRQIKWLSITSAPTCSNSSNLYTIETLTIL